MLNPKKTKNQSKYLRNNMTRWEIRLWEDLKCKKMFGFKVRRQHGIENFILDFYCPKLKLAIEIDGDVHSFPDKMKADILKEKALKEFEIHLVRLSNTDIDEDYESVVTHLEDVFKDRALSMKIDYELKPD
ncbi:endonuclease domain-containing protein [Rhodohalobacter mucosus]|uniref:Cytosine methyltransferase n=1 Tax=Rhodohalobacter mucosus TaxID=2079485 RepID=A0A316TT32_9BACT|nr:endonuclease domain-containing protein [Rhodohalobacter mucosus]PWN05434.1 cytosine methyltransferase [Rhodohalobacter mucosus]